MIKGIGIDITAVERFKSVPDKDRFLEQIFTENELQRSKKRIQADSYYAERFAVKEALFKALATGLHHGSYWHSVETTRNNQVATSGIVQRKIGNGKVLVSTTCSKQYAVGLTLVQDE